MNPYQPSQTAPVPAASRVGGLVRGVLFVVAGYYALCILTLPFANKVWWGEVPLLALPQLPKMWVCDHLQDAMIACLPWLGIDSGSPSPDMILTHPWALGATLLLFGGASLWLTSAVADRRTRNHWRLRLVALILVDAAITFRFDASSSLSLF